MAIPLRKLTLIVALAVSLAMVILLGLGVRQLQLYQAQQRVVAQTEKLVFQFAVIREHLAEALLAGRDMRLGEVVKELEDLHANLAGVMASKYIREEYKLGLFNNLDLPGLILEVKKLSAGPVSVVAARRLNREVRVLGERLLLFDRLLVNHAKDRLLRFQNQVIGLLVVMLVLILGVLLLAHHRLIQPVLAISRQVAEVARDREAILNLPARTGELRELAAGIREVVVDRDQARQDLAGLATVTEAVARALRAVTQARSREAMLRDLCRALLYNPEYCLVWIGEPDQDGHLLPVSADGATTMNNQECDTCVSVLLTEAEEQGEEKNPALTALRTGRAVVRRDILDGVPRGLLKGTPLAAGEAACAAIPVPGQGGKPWGVLSVYAGSAAGFGEHELDLLVGVAAVLGRLLVADQAGRLATTLDRSRASRLAVLGELSAGVAHEISDLCNGMINYAQVLADDCQGNNSQAGLLRKIIHSGEQIAEIAQKFIFYGQEQSQSQEYLPLEQVLRDALFLEGYHLRRDGIQLLLRLPEQWPPLPVKAQQMQQVFLHLFANARRALNQRYPGRDPDKLLEVAAEVVREAERRLLRLTLTDHGIGIERRRLDRLFEPAASEQRGEGGGLPFCREVVEQHGGTMTVESVMGEFTRLTLIFPLEFPA